MAFKGAVGVSIVIISLFASAILGVLINVNQEDVLKDVDHYQSDITGLFSSDKDKSYAEYNTAKNFNGYTSTNINNFPVDFTESNVANNYPFSYHVTNAPTKTATLTDYYSTSVSDVYSIYNDFGKTSITPYFAGWQSNQSSYDRIQLADLIQTEMNYATTTYGSPPDTLTIEIPFSKQTTTTGNGTTLYYPTNWATILPNNYIGVDVMSGMVLNNNAPPSQYTYQALSNNTLRNIICEYDTNSNTCLLDFGSGTIYTNVNPTDYSIVYVSSGNFRGSYYPTVSSNNVVGSGTYSDPYTYVKIPGYSFGSVFGTTSGSTKYFAPGAYVEIDAYGDMDGSYGVVNVSDGHGLTLTPYFSTGLNSMTGNITGGVGETIQMDFRVESFHVGTTNYTFYMTLSLPPAPETYVAPNGTNDITIDYAYSKTTKFMDPRYGIAARPGETVTWSNDYSNGEMDIVVKMESVGNNYYNKWDLIYQSPMPSPLTYEYKNSIEMTHYANGTTTITLTSYNGSEPNITTVDFGNDWVGFNIHINATTGNVRVDLIPPASWVNFQNWTIAQSIDVGTFSLKGDIEYIQIFGDASANAFNFQIASTSVFLNTYGIIKIDSSINILKWYPNNDHYKMKFSKTSAVGSSVLLGSDLYTISNDKITVDGKEIDVKDMVLEYERNEDSWEITISSAKTGNSAELTSSSTNVGLNGAWYFTCEYYTVSEELVKENIWEPNKGVAYGISGIILIMLILNIVIGIGVWKFAPNLMELPDIVILIGAEILLFIILT